MEQKKFEILDAFSCYGRGEVVICKNGDALKVGTKVRINGNEYTIRGKEWSNKLLDPVVPSEECALTFTPNAPIVNVEIGDIIEIIDKH